jgi:ribosomal protein S18 acetylase RimI-like enzyme
MAAANPVKLQMRPALGFRDFMLVRRIRNSCREYMTRDQSHISFPRQLLYFLRYHMVDRMSVLYIGEDEFHRPIAYGLISYDETLTPWVSGGILPGYRGHGYGRELFKYISEQWHFPIWLEVLASNLPALKLYNGLGFLETKRVPLIRNDRSGASRQETVITMRKNPC